MLAVEVLLLVCFFTGLYFGGGLKEAASEPPSAAASGLRCSGSGWWASACCCPSCCLCGPDARWVGQNGHLALVCSPTLVGILLRYFVLYAGQMTVV